MKEKELLDTIGDNDIPSEQKKQERTIDDDLILLSNAKKTDLSEKIKSDSILVELSEKAECRNVPFDFHNHSTQSPDGENTVEDMVRQAIQLGMKHYTITDHLEINKFYDEEFLYEEPVRESSIILPQLKEKYKNEISLQYGVELGQPLHDMDLTKRMLESYDYDFIIGSCHMVRGYDDFYFLDYKEIDPNFLLRLYFEELLEMAEWGKFDSLGHLTYPLRYIVGDKGIPIEMEPYETIIDKIFLLKKTNSKFAKFLEEER